jgi:hypothetical protein
MTEVLAVRYHYCHDGFRDNSNLKLLKKTEIIGTDFMFTVFALDGLL